ncbi:hypothetical protein OGAPHI_001650 [Ogataea philodendri]|uniref:Cytochrome c oxidase assembly protein COX15 n=1 Tax=Ogataea philodendri TaxID=1378263 RepID=A0A9P8PCP6_9ASCO|nr:uncharacterized protein OGAPHI_001650 [Ogataea philodendri]KAH3669054.1 hypothetical protein OGAPHI_001650 [Ogataea philodendri]
MLFCRSQFFFVKNSSLLKAGFKNTSVKHSSQFLGIGARKPKAVQLSTIPYFSSTHTLALPKSNLIRPSTIRSGLSQKRMFSTTPISFQQATKTIRRSKWPANTNKNLGYLCIGTSILVFAIVILGGLTRLTESGLSITEWKPVTGAIPPRTQEDWEEEFKKYQESPEFKLLNSHITLEEFKFIFYMEWSHRLLGRIIGTVFVLPTLYYIARRQVSPPVAFKLLGICALIGLQGAIGWWMVYSGIDEQLLEERKSKPTVSQYRLTAHLGAAFLVYCTMISTGFGILRDHDIMKHPKEYLETFQKIQSPSLKLFRRLSKGLLGLVFVTAMSGAMVAGLDAGLIYNTFPHMGDDYIPSANELFSPVFSRLADQSDLIWRNMFENPATVQLNHRIMATLTLCSVFALHMYSHRIRSIIPRPAYKWLNISMGVVSLQVTLGICTLLWLVPIELAAAHQGGALALLTSVLITVCHLKKPTRSNLMLLKNFLEKSKANNPILK